jgi:hypothetical protein
LKYIHSSLVFSVFAFTLQEQHKSGDKSGQLTDQGNEHHKSEQKQACTGRGKGSSFRKNLFGLEAIRRLRIFPWFRFNARNIFVFPSDEAAACGASKSSLLYRRMAIGAAPIRVCHKIITLIHIFDVVFVFF